MSGQLLGQVGLVTGGGRGIGAAIACALAEEGMAVAVTSRSADQLAATVARIEHARGHAIAVVGDIADPDDVDRIFQHVTTELGPVDLLVNNAGRGPARFGAFWEADMVDWWSVLAVNLLGPALASHAVLPDMVARRTGRIVNIGSLAGGGPWDDAVSYVVSKAALMRLTDSLSAALEGTGVGVFELNPGLVRTALLDTHPTMFANLPDDVFTPVEFAAAAVVRIAAGHLDALRGRILDADDNFDDLVVRADEIRAIDARTLRVRTFGAHDPLEK